MLNGARIGLLESHSAQRLAELVARYGGRALSAPAVAKIPIVEYEDVRAFLAALESQPPELVVFQTGTGTRALFEATESRGERDRLVTLMQAGLIAVRGPKPSAVLRFEGVRIDRAAASPHTTVQLLECLADLNLQGRHVVVQRYGETHEALMSWLARRGAEVHDVPAYRWALPENMGPIKRLIEALLQRAVDAVVFTSASQVRNLLTTASQAGCEASAREALQHVRLISIGPVCTSAMRQEGLAVAAEASAPRLGQVVPAIARALARTVL